MSIRSKAPTLSSLVRQRRMAAGLSQQELAEKVGLTRQALSAIEAGHYSPNTAVSFRLARILGCRVDDLFILEEPFEEQPVEIFSGNVARGARLAVTKVRGRLVGHTLEGEASLCEGFSSAEGIAPRRAGQRGATLLVDARSLDRAVLLMGCDPSLGILTSRLAATSPDVRVRWLAASSRAALEALSKGATHIAGTHLRDPATGEDNLVHARAALAPTGGIVVAFTSWEQGLMVRRGNAKKILTVEDLARPDVSFINRESGAGTRAIVEQLLVRAGIGCDQVRGWDREVTSHLAGARAVAAGGADAGLGIRATAVACGLDFVPVEHVRFDLVIPADHLEHPAVIRLLELLQERQLKEELSRLAGYEVEQMGSVLATVRPAPLYAELDPPAR